METILALLIVLEYLSYETTQDVRQIEQEALLENRVEDAQEKCLRSADARRYSPVKEASRALLPSCNCLEIQAHQCER